MDIGEEGVNPLHGCPRVLLPMPVLSMEMLMYRTQAIGIPTTNSESIVVLGRDRLE